MKYTYKEAWHELDKILIKKIKKLETIITELPQTKENIDTYKTYKAKLFGLQVAWSQMEGLQELILK